MHCISKVSGLHLKIQVQAIQYSATNASDYWEKWFTNTWEMLLSDCKSYSSSIYNRVSKVAWVVLLDPPLLFYVVPECCLNVFSQSFHYKIVFLVNVAANCPP